MLNRAAPDAPAEMALTASEIHLLDHVLTTTPDTRKTLSYYLNKIARLGGYLARASDPPPGNLVMWRGLSRLRDIEIGASISAICGVIESFTGWIRFKLRIVPGRNGSCHPVSGLWQKPSSLPSSVGASRRPRA